MPLQTIAQYPNFFSALAGAIAAWAGAYGAMRAKLKELERSRDEHKEEMEDIRCEMKQFISKADYLHDKETCQNLICRRIDRMEDTLLKVILDIKKSKDDGTL